MSRRIIIIGSGQAALQVAISLRGVGFDGDIRVIGEEPYLPYMRPPLSKQFLAGKSESESLFFKLQSFFDTERIDLILGVRAIAIDRVAKNVCLSNGSYVDYDILVLATGARARRLDVARPESCDVTYLRTLDDAVRLVSKIESASRVVVVGGGFIGLEVAAAVAVKGKNITVLESSDRLMARAISPALSARFLSLHRQQGVDVVLNAQIRTVETGRGLFQAMTISEGRKFEADLIVAGVGVVPNAELAAACGLATADGVVVDDKLKTNDHNIYAIGDCARFPLYMQNHRLESVQNAVDQAKYICESIMGNVAPYRAVPWFWTEQYNWKLQIAGIRRNSNKHIVVGDYDSHKFSVEHFDGGRLESVESINSPGEHLRARKRIFQDMMTD